MKFVVVVTILITILIGAVMGFIIAEAGPTCGVKVQTTMFTSILGIEKSDNSNSDGTDDQQDGGYRLDNNVAVIAAISFLVFILLATCFAMIIWACIEGSPSKLIISVIILGFMYVVLFKLVHVILDFLEVLTSASAAGFRPSAGCFGWAD
jgi:hypothetical protein